jgi:hypothetical protein
LSQKQNKNKKCTGGMAQVAETCLACARPSVQTPVLQDRYGTERRVRGPRFVSSIGVAYEEEEQKGMPYKSLVNCSEFGLKTKKSYLGIHST